jgi:hypothetical protein
VTCVSYMRETRRVGYAKQAACNLAPKRRAVDAPRD